MDRLARFIVNHSKLIILGVIIINILGVISFTRASLTVSLYSFFQTGEEYFHNFFHLSEKYGGAESVHIVLSSEEKITTKEILVAIWDYFGQIERVEGVSYAFCFMPPMVPTKTFYERTTPSVINERYNAIFSMLEDRGAIFSNLLSR